MWSVQAHVNVCQKLEQINYLELLWLRAAAVNLNIMIRVTIYVLTVMVLKILVIDVSHVIFIRFTEIV